MIHQVWRATASIVELSGAKHAAVGVYVSNARAKVSTVARAASVAKEPEIGNIKGVAEVVE